MRERRVGNTDLLTQLNRECPFFRAAFPAGLHGIDMCGFEGRLWRNIDIECRLEESECDMSLIETEWSASTLISNLQAKGFPGSVEAL